MALSAYVSKILDNGLWHRILPCCIYISKGLFFSSFVQGEVVVGKILPSFLGQVNLFWKVEKVVRPAIRHWRNSNGPPRVVLEVVEELAHLVEEVGVTKVGQLPFHSVQVRNTTKA